jgi:hypothetical protein
MAEVIIHETLQPTDEVLARHRRVFEESGTRVLGEPQVELVPNPHAKGSHEPSEFYRITFQVEAPEEVPGVEALSEDELAAVVRFVRALVDHDEAVLREAGAYDHRDLTNSPAGGACGTTSIWSCRPANRQRGRWTFFDEEAASLRRSCSACSPSRKAGRT